MISTTTAIWRRPQIATKIVASVLSMAQVACIDIHALPRRAVLSWESDRHIQQMELFS